MSFVVLSSDPSSAMMISEGNIVCLKMLSKQSRKASGQLYVAMINDIVIPFSYSRYFMKNKHANIHYYPQNSNYLEL